MAHTPSIECFLPNKFTSYLSLCVSLNSFCNETSRTWASLSPETRCMISVGRLWVLTEFESQHVCTHAQLLRCVWHTVTPWTVAGQAPLSMEFSRQEYGGVLPFPSPGNFPKPEIESRSPALWAGSLPFGPPGKPQWRGNLCNQAYILQKVFC